MRPFLFAFKKSPPAGSATSTPAITSYNAGFEGSGGTGNESGFKFTVGSSALTVTALGFRRHSGTYANRNVIIRDNAGATVASVYVVYTNAAAGEDTYTEITPVVLSANTIYHITTGDNSGGNYNAIYGTSGCPFTSTAAITINDVTNQLRTNAYGLAYEVNFKYQT